MKKLLLNLLTKNAANPIEGVINTALSLIRDKTKDASQSFIRENVRKGISISSKRVLNLGITTSIIIVALSIIKQNGLDKWTLALLGIGVAYSVAMSFITSWKEKD